MSLLARIKTAQLQARKAKAPVTIGVLTTLIGEAEAIGKNNGNREVTDIEVVALIKKFIKNIGELLAVVQTTDPAWDKATQEQMILAEFLPKQLTSDEINASIEQIVTEIGAMSQKDMGKVMKVLKERFEGQYDGTIASQIIKARLSS